MIKQVWVAVNPQDDDDIEVWTYKPDGETCYFEDVGLAEWKPAMLIVEDEE